MIEYKSILLKDAWPYRDVQFKVPDGITTIYGLNRTTKSSSNGNASGKSFLMSQIHELQFGKPNIGLAQDKVQSGVRELRILSNGKKVRIVHSGKNIELRVDGKSINRKVRGAIKDIYSYVPITQDEFNTYVYFDSRIGHPLVMGSGEERRRFFTSFFKLDRNDLERKRYNNLYRELKNNKLLFNELMKQYRELDSESELTIDQLKAKIQKTNDRLQELTIDQSKFRENQRISLFLKSTKEQRRLLKKYGATDKQSILELKDKIKHRLFKAEDYKVQAKEYNKYLKEKEEYEKEIEGVDKKYIKLLADRKKVEKRASRYRSAKQEFDRLGEAKECRKPKPVDKPKIEYALVHSNLQLLKSKLKVDFSSGQCPTCGSDVEFNVNHVKKEYRKYQRLLSDWESYDNYLELLEKYKEAKEYNERLASRKSELKSELKSNHDYYVASKYTHLVKPAKVEKPKSKYDLKELRSLSDAIRIVLPNANLLDAKTDDSDDYSELINNLSNKLSKLNAQLSLLVDSEERKGKLKPKLKELKAKIKHEEELKVLTEAYKDKHLKKMMIDQISEALVQQINKYSKFVFKENYSFQILNDTRMSIICNRKYGDVVHSSDVRKLSGAEHKMFSLVLIMALLSFVEDERRSNLLVLDEPSANMSEETRQVFVEFLKFINTKIQSIVIITPRSEEVYPGHKFTAVKHNGWSKLVKGIPSEVK